MTRREDRLTREDARLARMVAIIVGVVVGLDVGVLVWLVTSGLR